MRVAREESVLKELRTKFRRLAKLWKEDEDSLRFFLHTQAQPVLFWKPASPSPHTDAARKKFAMEILEEGKEEEGKEEEGKEEEETA